jgi:hypothetical protein
MSAQEARPLVNRDEPIPVVSISSPGDNSRPRTPNQHHASKPHLSASKLKNKLESLGENFVKESPSRVSDRLITMFVHPPSLCLTSRGFYLGIHISHVTND